MRAQDENYSCMGNRLPPGYFLSDSQGTDGGYLRNTWGKNFEKLSFPKTGELFLWSLQLINQFSSK